MEDKSKYFALPIFLSVGAAILFSWGVIVVTHWATGAMSEPKTTATK